MKAWSLRIPLHPQEERGAPVDVQIGPQVYEGASQDLRRRLWISLLDNGSLASDVTHSNVGPAHASGCALRPPLTGAVT